MDPPPNILQPPNIPMIPQLSYSSSANMFSPGGGSFSQEETHSAMEYYSNQYSDQYSDVLSGGSTMRRIPSVPSYGSFETSTDAETDLGLLGISAMCIDPAPAAMEHASDPSISVPPQFSLGWAFADITDQLGLQPGNVSEDVVKAAVKESKDRTTEGWISRGSIRAWCTQCGADQSEGRHKMLVLRYRCDKACCDSNTCTLQAKYLFCPVSGRVYYSTHGGHALRQTAPRQRRGITAQLKRFIENLVEQGKSPSTIASDLQSTMGEESPSLRQIQNFVFRFKKKRESLRRGKGVSSQLPPPTLTTPSPPQATATISVSKVSEY
ncbi:hypothetical protein J8273_7940 [Carpediemonas membranifera]|uniref:Uncharacterized protein n=1 Tax=Carpediemonas membranifera TaxID=201153 RepID=A0A8J6AYU2_9EUKA|nr:hypothetical protein J8273_7940 [Carpediemonas membranifera]|eukprot:KAG9390589.1 hypothetical protein J8273_7940 [Carpediemonas membranifera]